MSNLKERKWKITFQVKLLSAANEEKNTNLKEIMVIALAYEFMLALLTSVAGGGVVGNRHDGSVGGGQTSNAWEAFS